MSDSVSKATSDSDTNLLIWGVDVELKKRFKAKCAMKEETMKEAILHFMAEYAKRK